jgi:hypothetical protein
VFKMSPSTLSQINFQHTFRRCRRIISSIPITWDPIADLHTPLELGLQEVAFVEEEDELDVGQQFACAEGLPEFETVFQLLGDR